MPESQLQIKVHPFNPTDSFSSTQNELQIKVNPFNPKQWIGKSEVQLSYSILKGITNILIQKSQDKTS